MAALPPQVVAPPEGKARFFHYSRPENAASIRENGLLLSKAAGETYGETNQVWGASVPDDRVPRFLQDQANRGAMVAEFHVSPDELHFGRERSAEDWRSSTGHATVLGDVPPESIRHVHEPWESTARYLQQDNRQPDSSLDHVIENGHNDSGLKQGAMYHRIAGLMQEDLDR